MSQGQPFWRISQPQFTSVSAKGDLAQFLEAVVVTFNLCVDRNVLEAKKLDPSKEWTRKDVSDKLKEFCMTEIFNNSRIYKYNLSRQIERLNFNNVVTQWGYMYVYMCRHIHLVYHVMSTALRRQSIVVHPDVKSSICAIGAGPGSDVLGLLMFFREVGIPLPFSEIHFLDRCVAWNESWKSLVEKLPKDVSEALVNTNYHHFDFFDDDLSESIRQVVSRATFVTFIKSISPVSAWLRERKCRHRPPNAQPARSPHCWHSVHSILECIQPGATVLYIDNGSAYNTVHRKLILDSASLLGFHVLYDVNLSDFRMPCDSFSKNCKDFMKYMDFRPCSVSGKNDALLLWKPYNVRRY